MLFKAPLLNVNITTSSEKEIIEGIKIYLSSSKSTKPLTIVTPNPEQIVLSQKDSKFRTQLNASDIALPDGIGIVWALKRIHFGKTQGKQINDFRLEKVKRIAGTDFMLKLVELAAEQKYTVGFVGGFDNVAERTFNVLKLKYPTLIGWSDPGPDINIKNQILNIKNTNQKSNIEEQNKLYIQQLIGRIKTTRTRLVFIGLGAPKQEYFLSELRNQLSKLKTDTSMVLMVVGGAFDYISGYKKRAPQIVQRIGFEWLWRLINEPSRWKRQMALPQFVFLVLKSKTMLK